MPATARATLARANPICPCPPAPGSPRPRDLMSERLRLNPIACEAHGMCAELLPERISLDEWGYPILDERPLSPDLVSHAQRAAQACPTFALLVERERSRG